MKAKLSINSTGLIFVDELSTNRSIFYIFENNFVKKSKISILVPDSSHKSLLIILTAFFD